MYQNTAHFYDFFTEDPTEYSRGIEFISSYIVDKPATLIDIGAGTGETARALAARGHRLFCIEPSPSMYSMLVSRLRDRNGGIISAIPVRLEKLKAPLGAELAYATSVFSHLSIRDRNELLIGLKRHLKPGGRFIFNCTQYVSERPDKPVSLRAEKTVGEVVFRHFDSSEQIDSQTRRVTWRFEIEYSGQILQRYDEDFFLNMLTPEAVRTELESAGFELLDAFADYDRTKIHPGKPGLVFIASRK